MELSSAMTVLRNASTRIYQHFQSQTVAGKRFAALHSIMCKVRGTEGSRNEKFAGHASGIYCGAELKIPLRNCMKYLRVF